APELKARRLMIVSEGVLQYLPFAALPDPTYAAEMTRDEKNLHPSSFIPHPLIVDHEIINLPSASVLAVLRREIANRGVPSKTVAVLADPVFSDDDPRVRNSHHNATEPISLIADAKSSAAESGLADLVRLRF